MSENDIETPAEPEPARWRSGVGEVVLILLLGLSLVGVWITEFSPADSYWYWMIMIFVFAFSAMIIGGISAKRQDSFVKDTLLMQTFHWGASMLIVLAVFSLLNAGRLSSENTGLVIMLVISLATFLDGIRIGWRFSMVGVFLGITAVVAGHTAHFMWIAVLLAIGIVALTLFWEARQRKRRAA